MKSNNKNFSNTFVKRTKVGCEYFSLMIVVMLKRASCVKYKGELSYEILLNNNF